MKSSGTWLLVALLSWAAATACAQLQPVPAPQPQPVFGGGERKIDLLWHNAGTGTTTVKISAHLLQTSSATTAAISDVLWKNLTVLPQQTVVESARLNFPAVRAETKFLIQWTGNSNQVLGVTTLLVYPTNLLDELKTLFQSDDLGVLDPDGELKPALRQNGVEFTDLEETALEEFHGKLAILGPFRLPAQMREGTSQSIRKMTANGVAVVWLQPPSASRTEIIPSFYVLPGTKAAAVVVQPELIAHFLENPQSQLNLAYCCKLALNPAPFLFSSPASQP